MQPPIKRDSHPTASEATTQLKDIRKTLPLRVLSQADWLHWTTTGYVIVRQAVPAATVERLVDVSGNSTRRIPTIRRPGTRRSGATTK